MTAAEKQRGSLTNIRLVAGREVSTRIKSKSYLVSTAALIAIIVLGAVGMQFLSDDGEDTTTVGLTPAAAGASARIMGSAQAFQQQLVLTPAPDAAAGKVALDSGDLSAIVDVRGDRLAVTVKSELSDELRNTMTVASNRLALDKQITSLGGDPRVVDQRVAAAGVDVEELDPPREFNGQQLAIGSIAGILIFLALQFAGQYVAQGVVEEKASRVVEVLLATIRPVELMAGKVVGIGIVGLIQVALIAACGLGAGVLTDAITLPTGTVGSALLWLIVWFFLGYCLYALAFAASAALVSRQEDVGGVTAPLLTLMIIPYIAGISFLPSDPTNEVVRVMSLVPPFAPFLMPMRIAMGNVPAWEIALSVGLVVLLIPVLVVLSARIYRRAIVRSGSRVKLLEVLR